MNTPLLAYQPLSWYWTTNLNRVGRVDGFPQEFFMETWEWCSQSWNRHCEWTFTLWRKRQIKWIWQEYPELWKFWNSHPSHITKELSWNCSYINVNSEREKKLSALNLDETQVILLLLHYKTALDISKSKNLYPYYQIPILANHKSIFLDYMSNIHGGGGLENKEFCGCFWER